jgi:phage-related protein
MDQRAGELNKINEENLTGTENTETSLKPRAATSSDVAASERDIAADLQKLEDTGADTTADEPEQIKEQIEQTRSQMSETINAIEEKLSFSNISGQVSEHINNAVETAKGAVYDATLGKAENLMKNIGRGFNDVTESVGDAGTHVVKYARQNPLPLALIGLGVGMLLMQGRRTTTYNYGNGGSRRGNDQGESRLGHLASTGTNALSSAKDTVTNAAGTAYEGVGNVASSAYEGVTHAASSAYGGVTNVASSAYQGVSRLASTTGNQIQNVAHRAQDQYSRTLEENPLAIGAIALAVGAIVGLAIPATQYENQWMGETRENLVHTVEDAARDAFSRVQEVATEVTKTVQEQAKGQANS